MSLPLTPVPRRRNSTRVTTCRNWKENTCPPLRTWSHTDWARGRSAGRSARRPPRPGTSVLRRRASFVQIPLAPPSRREAATRAPPRRSAITYRRRERVLPGRDVLPCPTPRSRRPPTTLRITSADEQRLAARRGRPARVPSLRARRALFGIDPAPSVRRNHGRQSTRGERNSCGSTSSGPRSRSAPPPEAPGSCHSGVRKPRDPHPTLFAARRWRAPTPEDRRESVSRTSGPGIAQPTTNGAARTDTGNNQRGSAGMLSKATRMPPRLTYAPRATKKGPGEIPDPSSPPSPRSAGRRRSEAQETSFEV